MIYTSSCTPVPIPNIDICSFLFLPNEYNQKRAHNRPILIDGNSGKTLSYAQVRDQCSRLAAGWRDQLGLKKGDVVAVFAPNQYDHALLYFSILGAQCTVTPGNPNYTKAEFEHQLRTSNAQAIVTVPELLPTLSQLATECGIPRERVLLFGDRAVDGYQSFYSLMSNRSITYPLPESNAADDVAFICFSSGTTGVAKGVMLTHRNFVAQMLIVTLFEYPHGAPETDVILAFLPFYHIFGLTTLCLRAFYTMNPVVIMYKYDLQKMCQLVQQHTVTVLPIVPPVAVHLAKSPIVQQYNLSSLRMIGCGAAPLGREHIDALNLRINAPVRQGYGMTETTAGCIYQKVGISPAGSTGVLINNMECKLVDADGNAVGPDQDGEILLRGPTIMKGYINNATANAETFTEGGWMRTGDVARFDSQYNEFFIVDRIKELIKYKGYQVAPAELEAVLMSHKDVADCCVVGVYDAAEATELPRAYVVLQSTADRTEAFAEQLVQYVASHVTRHKHLRAGVRFIDVVPKSPSGKILRRQVREWVKQEMQDKASETQARL
ncbi:uncharacterized protein BYT42DRAFT_557637 [Radiomyces spectabilis]|uniref:uncharacterized protein n=1 Tax=Radiomyces spectabilis TaxID=64574 RepID=UPI002221010B|nr:uncharacterized protein BYT42DRAFT_557637 [Radiomyces spectabilis]KAI8391662.1 hypothetical protein BYT42DRAFT_557637 [Radiomyces spectabilis]